MKEKHCSLTSEWRRCVYDPGRCRKCRAAKIRARIAHLRSGLPLAEYQCPYFERAAATWPGVAGAATESLEATAARFAAMMADVMPTTEEAVENLKRVTAQLDFVGKQ